MAWLYLIFAGLLEIGWPVGLKMAQQNESRVTGITIAVIFVALSGLFLCQKDRYRSGRDIFYRCVFYGDPQNFGRHLGVTLIIAGVATLKLAN